jgi:hypothetical protein
MYTVTPHATAGIQRKSERMKIHKSNKKKKCYTEGFHISQRMAALNALEVAEILGQRFSQPASI